MINRKLWLDHIQRHLEEDCVTCYAIISNFVSVYKTIVIGMKVGAASSFHIFFKYELDGAAKLAELYFVLVNKA